MDLHRETWKDHEIVIPREPQRTKMIDEVPAPPPRVLDAARESPKRAGTWVAVRL